MRREREITKRYGVEWSPGYIEMWDNEDDARRAFESGDGAATNAPVGDYSLVVITEIREYLEN